MAVSFAAVSGGTAANTVLTFIGWSHGCERKPAKTASRSVGLGSKLSGLTSTTARCSEGSSTATSESPASRRWARSAGASSPCEQRLETGVARDGADRAAADEACGFDRERSRGREPVLGGHDGSRVEDDPIDAGDAQSRERAGIDRPRERRAPVDGSAEEPLDRLVAADELGVDRAGQPGGEQRREVDGHVGRGDDLVRRGERAHGVGALGERRVVAPGGRPGLERLGAGDQRDRHVGVARERGGLAAEAPVGRE